MSLLHKSIDISACELKFVGEKQGFFAGYASKFNGVDAYGDTIVKGAYEETLQNRERPIAMRWNHYGPVIGKWLKMEEDDVGLYVEGELTPGHSKAEDVYASLKHGAITGLSIGFRPVEIEERDDSRILKKIDLVEISVVESPADNGAHVESVKAALDAVESLKEIESLLRDAGGFSRAEATAIVSRVKAISQPRDAELKTEDETAILRAILKLKSI
jgi:HK97 family phage prohead protease